MLYPGKVGVLADVRAVRAEVSEKVKVEAKAVTADWELVHRLMLTQ